MTDEQWRQRLIAAALRDRDVRARLAADSSLFDGYHPEMEAVHVENARLLEQLVDAIGAWPGRSRFGDDGAAAAFTIVQHAISLPAFQRRMLALLLDAAGRGEINVVDTAYLSDRIAVFEGRAQIFGTQFDWDEHGQLCPAPIAEPVGVDQRRASVGLPSMADAVAHMRAQAAADGERAPADLPRRRAAFEQWARRVGWRA
ncbi:MAG: hypothetical protein K2P58_11870 [Hyphomonadaceae bacterium]|nr:hypothetical protein [Hyphomonadaceae bacterium]